MRLRASAVLRAPLKRASTTSSLMKSDYDEYILMRMPHASFCLVAAAPTFLMTLEARRKVHCNIPHKAYSHFTQQITESELNRSNQIL
jgi:hypothetical protein